MKNAMKKLLFSILFIFAVLSQSSAAYAEKISGDTVISELMIYMEENYREILTDQGIVGSADNLKLGSVYYIFDESTYKIGQYFYVPVVQEGQIITVLKIEYNDGKYNFISTCSHNVEVLNELDYLNQECCIYRIGSEIYAENMNEWKLLYVETIQNADAGELVSNEIQAEFQEYVYTIKLRHYKDALSWTRYGEDEPVEEEKTYVSQTYSGIRIEDAECFMKEVYKDVLKAFYLDYNQLGAADFKEEEIDELELGRPFLDYNVDVVKAADVYFPLYKDGVVTGITGARYYEGCWHASDGISQSPIMLDYKEEEVIYYSINNTWYAESRKKRLKVGFHYALDETIYSKEELSFMKITWKEKLQLVREAEENLTEYTNVYDDWSRQTIGEVQNQNAEEFPAVAEAGCIILAAGVLGMTFLRLRNQKKSEINT